MDVGRHILSFWKRTRVRANSLYKLEEYLSCGERCRSLFTSYKLLIISNTNRNYYRFDVSQRHATSVKAYTHQPWCVLICLAISVVVCAHQSGDIGHDLISWHRSWHAWIGQATSANSRQYLSRPTRISRGNFVKKIIFISLLK